MFNLNLYKAKPAAVPSHRAGERNILCVPLTVYTICATLSSLRVVLSWFCTLYPHNFKVSLALPPLIFTFPFLLFYPFPFPCLSAGRPAPAPARRLPAAGVGG